MPRDELRQPLRRRSTSERLWSKRPSALTAVALLTFVGFVSGGIWLSRIPHPFAGEPIVMAAIPPVEELKTGSTDKAPDDGETAAAEELQPPEAVPEEAAVVEDFSAETQIIVPRQRPLKPAPIAAITEDSDQGPLPKIGQGGKKPSDLYAQITPMSVLASDRPKIVILLGGMGLNTKLTGKAIHDLPGDITLGFAPYGGNLQEQVDKARARGHEVMLQLPMEPVGYPAVNPGPNTLLADADAESNLFALHWNRSRFTGYTGVTNYLGARFLATPETLKPVLAELKKRGLVFLQDATIALSSTDEVARATGMAVRHGEIVIDANPDAASIAAALKQLEAQAQSQGIAVGTGTGLEVTIDAVNDWARDLNDRGFVLVPVSAAYKGKTG